MKAALGKASVRYKKVGDLVVIEVEMMAGAGGEADLFKSVVNFCHGADVLVTLAPRELEGAPSALVEA